MKLVDINSNYSDVGGGIRTYHRAKSAWFDRQRRHRYYFIVPGPKPAVRRIGPRSVRIEVYGCPLTAGYRLLLDYRRVWVVLHRLRPQAIEAGDPFLTTLFCLLLRALRLLPGRLTAFYHSDPIETWVVPWAGRGWAFGWRRGLAALAGRLFYRLQRRYDVTIVASRTMQQHLRAQGVDRVVRKPLGVEPIFFATCRESTSKSDDRPRRLLFVGRLGSDKGADLLLSVLPRILNMPDVQCTIVGSGPLEGEFAQLGQLRLHLRGYVRDRAELAAIYAEHQILLAPGPYETFGLAVLEAMAAGLVVVGPDRGGTADLLREADSPCLFRARDADDFLRAIQAAVAGDLGAQSVAAQAVARRYGTWDEAMGRLVGYYEVLCGAGQSPEPTFDPRRRLDAPATIEPTIGPIANDSPAIDALSNIANSLPGHS